MIASTVRADDSAASLMLTDSKTIAPAQALIILDERSELAQHKRLELQDLNREYELRAHYGLLSREERADHDSKLRAFSSGFIEDLGMLHARETRSRAKEGAVGDRGGALVARPLLVLAGAYLLYRGETVRADLGGGARLAARSSPEKKGGNVDLSSKTMNGSVSTSKDERLRTGAARALPLLDLQSGVAYGWGAQRVNTSLSRQLMPSLTGVWESSRPVAQASGGREDTLKLLFGVRF